MPVIGNRPEVSVRRIMVATDLSSSGDRACVYAAALSERFGATLDMVHVEDIALGTSDVSVGAAISEDAFRKQDEHALRKLARRFHAHSMECHVLEGCSVVEELLLHAEKTLPQILCMGTKSPKGFHRLLFGANAEGVFRRSRFPVLVLGPHAAVPSSPLTFRNIVLASSFSPESQKAALFAFAFAQDSGANIHLCHVLPPEPENQSTIVDDMLLQSLQKLVPPGASDWCSPVCTIQHGNAATALLHLARNVNADLIVMGPRDDSIHLSLQDRISPAVLADAACPVLMVRSF